MTTTQQLHDEAYAAWDHFDAATLPWGTVLRFDVLRPEGDHWGSVRTYAALLAAGEWYLTGGSAPNGVATEDFVAWLIERDVTPFDVRVLS